MDVAYLFYEAKTGNKLVGKGNVNWKILPLCPKVLSFFQIVRSIIQTIIGVRVSVNLPGRFFEGYLRYRSTEVTLDE